MVAVDAKKRNGAPPPPCSPFSPTETPLSSLDHSRENKILLPADEAHTPQYTDKYNHTGELGDQTCHTKSSNYIISTNTPCFRLRPQQAKAKQPALASYRPSGAKATALLYVYVHTSHIIVGCQKHCFVGRKKKTPRKSRNICCTYNNRWGAPAGTSQPTILPRKQTQRHKKRPTDPSPPPSPPRPAPPVSSKPGWLRWSEGKVHHRRAHVVVQLPPRLAPRQGTKGGH